MRFLLFLFSFFLLTATCAQEIEVDPKYAKSAQKLDTKKVLQTIAFGSCNDHTKSQEMWKHIVKNKPQLWMWLGDNIYADTKDMHAMADKYTQQKNHLDYRRLLACCPVIGTWDDHDYGANDAGKEFPKKKESKRLMLDFLDVPKDAPVRKREGAYQSYTFGEPGKKIKVILLDARYFRDNLEKSLIKGMRYVTNTEGDILGEAQWKWLEKELTNSDAQIHLIASGIQIIPEEHGYEKWANFPKARQRFFNLIQKTNPNLPVLLTGDRHIAEISKLNLKGLNSPLYEVTASGLTHSWSTRGEEPNQHRVGKMIIEKNFAVMKINWSTKVPEVSVEIRGLGNELFLKQSLK